jgi:undecaprenyl-diphosphatase
MDNPRQPTNPTNPTNPPASPEAPGNPAATTPPAPPPGAPPEETTDHLRHVMEEQVASVDSPQAAEAVVQRLEQLTPDTTEQEQGERTAASHVPAAASVTEAAQKAPSAPDATAAVFVKAAEQVTAPTPEAPAVLEAAQQVLVERPEPEPPEVVRGRNLLKEAILHRMGPLQALDTRLYLALNGFPHAPWSDRLANLITVWTTGGWIWIAGVCLGRLAGFDHSRRALPELIPSLLIATWIAEHPVKSIFRRQRPFADIVRALVVGKRPGSWSFPSGHTASSFAGAWVLSKIWRRQAPLFFALASTVGFSRIYVGAHYPGDVLSGALIGMFLAEIVHRPVRLLVRWCRVLFPILDALG